MRGGIIISQTSDYIMGIQFVCDGLTLWGMEAFFVFSQVKSLRRACGICFPTNTGYKTKSAELLGKINFRSGYLCSIPSERDFSGLYK